MKTRTILCLFVVLCFSLALFPQDANELISQGDELYNEMKEMTAAKEALEKYHKAMLMMEKKYDAYWRIARIMYYIGEYTDGKKEQQSIFSQGIYYAKKAVDEEPEKPDGYYWLGVNQGKYGEVKGVLKSLSLVKPIKNAMQKVIELDRSYEDGGPDRLLGRVYYKLPGFAGGSKDKSLEHLLKSLEYGPNDALTRLFLADTYLSLKETDKARAELDYILAMEDDPHWISGIEAVKEDARKTLQDKKFKE